MPAGTPGTNGTPGPEGKEGKAGKNGAAGSPWTADGTLPVGSTETGAWNLQSESSDLAFISISFTVPLAKALTEGHAHLINEKGMEETESGEVASTACVGSAAEPKAVSGNLCFYEAAQINTLSLSNEIKNPVSREEQSTGTTGALVGFAVLKKEGVGRGTWAVTG